jgi:hypothetical protein
MKNTEAPMGGDVNPTDLRLASGTQGTPGIMPGEESVVTDAISQTSMGQKTSGLMDAKEPGWESATSARQPSPTATSQVGDATRGDWGPDGPAGPGSGKKPGAFGMLSDFSEWANKNKMLAAIGANFIGGFFDSNKRAQTNYYNARTDEINTQIANGKSSPDMNFHLSGKVGFPTTAPTYRPVNVGLYGAKG